MKSVAVALLTALAVGPAHAQTHNADFPEQMAAIQRCRLEIITSGRKPLKLWSDIGWWACMERQGFIFCKGCQIFRYSGGSCQDDHDWAAERATCWRPFSEPLPR
jgi:hypothetical protein